MPEIKYGLISETDVRTLEKTVNLIHKEYDGGVTYILEVGCYGGDTANGLKQYVESTGGKAIITGIDNNKDGEPLRFQYDRFILGNSAEVYNQIPDESQHLIIIDALHTFPAVVADFFCYAPKVKAGGFIAFHDTGTHIDHLSQWQGVGDKNDPDMCLGGVRKALEKIGLFRHISVLNGVDELGNRTYTGSSQYGWELIFDEADPNDGAGGFCVFKKLY